MTHKAQPTHRRTGNTHGPGLLHECAELCSSTLAAYLRQSSAPAKESVVKALMDCADLCNVTATFVARDSKIHASVATLCVEACDACAAALTDAADDPTLKACADVCRACSHMLREELKHYA